MTERFRPGSAAELCDLVARASADGRSYEVVGSGSRRGFGRPVVADAVLDLGAFSGISAYEPEELVLSAGPATPLAALEALLAARRQRLAFEPPDLGPLWGQPEGQGTLGGALATGFGGPRRVVAGAPRDHFLGFRAVNGFGEVFCAGGRVVKNVTGYDLPKLMAGAFGTLGAMTEVTVKVLPRADRVMTLAAFGHDDANGLALLRQALGGPLPVTAAAHAPAGMAGRLFDGFAGDGRAVTLLRLESVASGVAAAETVLRPILAAGAGEVAELDEADSDRLWRRIGGGAAFAGGSAPVWRLSIPPSAAAATGEALRRGGASGIYFDWGGGAVWLEAADVGAAAIREIVREAGGGHATLVRGSPEFRAGVAPFEPLAPALAALTVRVKRQFDPAGVFNPGRMYEGL